MESIINEIKLLSSQGIREVTLLGQNVNSYCDETTLEFYGSSEHSRSAGFTSTCKTIKKGARFADLLEKVSAIDKEMRIRFTSPHPKDFPDELLYLMRERHNLCKQIHLPAQSGSTKVLESMNRGYSREAYLQLVEHIRSILPNVSLSSDFIAGFCGETEEDHLETVDLIKKVGYDMAYMFAYSLREKTKAHRRLVDDVSPEVKQARLAEIISTFYHHLTMRQSEKIGQKAIVLVEGESKKSTEELSGKADSGSKVVFPKNAFNRLPVPGEYVSLEITKVKGATLIGSPISFVSCAGDPIETI